MTTGWYERLIAGFGSGLCHQLPERSFEAGGVFFPVCSRCTGIYVGFAFALATLLWFYRQRHPSGRAAWPLYAAVALGILAMAWDGVTSYAGLRTTSNLLRLVTGTLFGGSIALVTYAMMVDVLLANRRPDRLLQSWGAIAAWSGSVVAAVVVVYLILPLAGPVAPALVALLLVGTFAGVGTAAIGLAARFRNSVGDRRSAVLPVLLGTAVGVATIILAKMLQAGLDRLVDYLLP